MESMELNDNEKNLVMSDQMIAAIKAHRYRTGLGLKESKDEVDKFYAASKGVQYSANPDTIIASLRIELGASQTKMTAYKYTVDTLTAQYNHCVATVHNLEAELRGVYTTLDKLGKKPKGVKK